MSLDSVSWEQAKRETQISESELASLIPVEFIDSIEQAETGTLFSCTETTYTWLGTTIVEIKPEIPIDDVVKIIEKRYGDNQFRIDVGVDVRGGYEIHFISTTTAENYLIGQGFEGHQLRIDSGSPCFTLPDDVWPGGDF